MKKGKGSKDEMEEEEEVSSDSMCPECKMKGDGCECSERDKLAEDAPQINKTTVVADKDEDMEEDDYEDEEDSSEKKPELFKKKMMILIAKKNKK